MRLAAISMIRDEADIIVPFVNHLAAFFDIAFLLDQRSGDGTGDVLREACAREGWSYQAMDFAGRHQKEVNDHFMRAAFGLGADVVFFIDSDEFVAFADKAALVAALTPAVGAGLPLAFRFRACVPRDFDQWHFDPGEALWIGDPDAAATVPAVTTKIAVPRSLYAADPAITIAQGNHAAFSASGSRLKDTIPVGHFYHLPIRSRQGFIQKVFLSAIANFAKANPMIEEGVHKRRLLEAIAERDLTDDTMAAIAAQYPPAKGVTWWESPVNLADRGFALGRLETAFADLGLQAPPRPDLHRVVARGLLGFMPENVEGGEGTLVFGDGVVRFRLHEAPATPAAQAPCPERPGRRRNRGKGNQRRKARMRKQRWRLRVALAVAAAAALALILALAA